MFEPEWTALASEELRTTYLLLGSCRELGRSPSAWTRRLSEGLREWMGVELGVFFEGDWGMVSGGASACPGGEIISCGPASGSVLGIMSAYWEQGGHDDDPPLSSWQRETEPVTARSRQELCSDAVWHESTAYREFYRRIGIDQMILARCPSADGHWLMLNLWRAAGDKAFTGSETLCVSLLAHEIGRFLEDGTLQPLGGGLRGLSPRMRQVLALLCEGRSEKQVAHALGISIHTVHNHVKRLHALFDVSSRGGLLAAASRQGLDGVTPFPIGPNRPGLS